MIWERLQAADTQLLAADCKLLGTSESAYCVGMPEAMPQQLVSASRHCCILLAAPCENIMHALKPPRLQITTRDQSISGKSGRGLRTLAAQYGRKVTGRIMPHCLPSKALLR